ncbi:MAG: hypothetical protein GEV07_12030 [Streptosporangiales bacterium]|nr:hypothetical protein [Streptosporangiales bacterium]
MLTESEPDAIVMHLNLPAIVPFANEIGVDLLDNLIRSALDAVSAHRKNTHFVLVLRSNGHPDIDRRKLDERQRAADLGIPVFDEYTNAARALAALGTYEARRQLLDTGTAEQQ